VRGELIGTDIHCGMSNAVPLTFLSYVWCRWGETTSLNCGHQRAYCSSPRWYMSMNNRGGMISTGKNFWFINQSSLAILSAELSISKAGRTGEGNEFNLRNIFVRASKGFVFNVKQNVTHRADGFTSPPKKGVLRIFVALKNPSPSVQWQARWPLNQWGRL
jgi:hypothetical protein